MSNIIPFDSGKLPAYLKNAAGINADITAHAGTGYAVVSIKGKQFAVVRDGDRSILMNPKDPDSPATSVEVVILKVSPAKSKVFYASGYVEGSDAKPTCFSNDGAKPDASVENPQAKLCATCPQNQWGAKITEAGKKTKACSDSVRLAVAPAGQLNDPMLLRVPPATIRPLGEYGQMLSKRGVPYNAVVTKIGFDPEAATPKLTFRATGFLPEDQYEEAQSVARDETVAAIISGGTSHEAASVTEEVIARAAAPAVSKDKTVTAAEVEQAVAAAESEAKPKPVKRPAPKAEDIDVSTDDLSLDDVRFDD